MSWVAAAVAGGAIIGGGINYLASDKASDAASGAADAASGAQLSMYNTSRLDLAPWREAGVNALRKLMGGYDVNENWLAKNPAPTRSKYMKSHHIKGGSGKYTTFDSAGYQKAMEKWEAKKPKGAYTAGLLESAPGYESVPEFTESPGYQFTLKEGLNAQQNALSAMGANRSGKHIKAATQYGQGLASTEYDNFLNRWYRDQAEKRNAFNNRLNPYLSVSGLGQTATTATGQLGANASGNSARSQMYSGDVRGAQYINQANALTGSMTGAANQLLYLNRYRNLPQQGYGTNALINYPGQMGNVGAQGPYGTYGR